MGGGGGVFNSSGFGLVSIGGGGSCGPMLCAWLIPRLIGSTGGGGAAPKVNTLRAPPLISAFFNFSSRSRRSVGSILVTSVPSFNFKDGRKFSVRVLCLRVALSAGVVGIAFTGTGVASAGVRPVIGTGVDD